MRIPHCCLSCHSLLKITVKLAGRRINCPNCGLPFLVLAKNSSIAQDPDLSDRTAQETAEYHRFMKEVLGWSRGAHAGVS